MSRLFFIPDIHGRRDLLDALWAKLEREEALDLSSDKVIFGGDYVDRGPDSAGVLSRIRELTEAHPDRVVALAGNHEWLMIDAIAKGGDHRDLWLMNGGGATLRSYIDDMVPDSVVKWAASLPLSHEEPGFFFSHAPLPVEHVRRFTDMLTAGPSGFSKNELIWTYFPEEGERARKLGGGIVGVCGHVHALNKQLHKGQPLAPRFWDHYIFADAGCGCHPKAPLVAVEVKSRKVIYAHPPEAMTTQSARRPPDLEAS